MAAVKEDVIAAKEIITNKLEIKSTLTVTDVEANGTSGTPSFGNIEPAGITTDTVAKWLKVTQGGVVYYIPMWT